MCTYVSNSHPISFIHDSQSEWPGHRLLVAVLGTKLQSPGIARAVPAEVQLEVPSPELCGTSFPRTTAVDTVFFVSA